MSGPFRVLQGSKQSWDDPLDDHSLFRNVTELILFGTRVHLRTAAPGRRQVNILQTQKREHSRKPDEMYDIIEQCSHGPYLELFARHHRHGWSQWGDEIAEASKGGHPQLPIAMQAALPLHEKQGKYRVHGA
jgi:hypothetical protein